MQKPPDISTALYNALAVKEQRLNVLVELYESDTLPGDDGFDPSDAILRVGNTATTFLGETYSRYLHETGSINRTITEKFNSLSLSLDNSDRTMAAFVLANALEGMILVVRLVSRAVTAVSLLDSFVVFTGRCEKTFDVTLKEVSISAKQYIGTVEEDIPWRTFDSEDEDGRLPDDVLYEGFVYKPQNVNVQYTERVPRGGILGIFGLKQTVTKTLNYTSQKEATDEMVVPVILGRAQAKLIPITSIDIGGAINSIMAAGEGPIRAWFDHRVLNPGYSQPMADVYRYGYPGGVNDQIPVFDVNPTNAYVGDGYYSKTAWTAFWINGADVSAQENAPESVALILGMLLTLPDASGDFTVESWSDNPAYQVRWVLTHPKIFNLHPALINDLECIKTACYCDAPVLDDTNGETVVLPFGQESRYGTEFRRYNSTGLFTPEYFKHYALGIAQDPLPVLRLAPAEFYDPMGGPFTPEPTTLVRRRFTSNIYLREKMKSADFLFKVLLPTFRGYISQNARGKLDIKCRRPADHTLIRSASVATATQVAVNNVLPWVGDLTGKVIVGNDLLTSEVRGVTSINYTTVANAITLEVDGNLTASGATFSGGTSGAPATASVTITGLGVLTVTIDGRDVSYETTAEDTTATAAAMLAQFLKADTTFQSYIKTTWDRATPDVINFESKIGFLNLDSALAEDHDLAEEVLRIQMSFADRLSTPADLIASNILAGTVRWPGGGRQSLVNRIDGTFIDSPQDFRPQPVRTRDAAHIALSGKVLTHALNLTGVDNFSQAKRLENNALAELRDLDFFMQHTSDRRALLLEEGDLICNTHASGGLRNVALRVQEVSIDLSRMTVSISAKRYSTSAYSDEAAARNVPLPTTLFSSGPPAIEFNSEDFPPNGLTQTTATEGITSVRGGALFGASVLSQRAKVSLQRPGEAGFTQIAIVEPDGDLKAVFEFIATAEGTYTVRLEVCTSDGRCNATLPTASITIVFGVLGALLTEAAGILLTEAGDFLSAE